MGLKLTAALIVTLAAPASAEILRIATWSPDLTRRGPGLLLHDMQRGDAQIDAAVQVIAAANADILLLTGFDWDHDGAALAGFLDLLSAAGAGYSHHVARQPNSGLQTGLDLDGDGRLGGGEDAQGYGRFTGVRGMVLLSRRPIQAIRDLTPMLWRDLPDHLMPEVTPEVAAVQRLSSTAHWDVGVKAGTGMLHLLTISATPPIFDGPEDRNGRRNHDEVALWLHEAPPERWVVMGKINLDPEIGEGRRGALSALLAQSNAPTPCDPDGDCVTVDWGPDRDGNPRRQRVDYLLPSSDMQVVETGILWPDDGPLRDAAKAASRHRLIWIDIDVP